MAATAVIVSANPHNESDSLLFLHMICNTSSFPYQQEPLLCQLSARFCASDSLSRWCSLSRSPSELASLCARSDHQAIILSTGDNEVRRAEREKVLWYSLLNVVGCPFDETPAFFSSSGLSSRVPGAARLSHQTQTAILSKTFYRVWPLHLPSFYRRH